MFQSVFAILFGLFGISSCRLEKDIDPAYSIRITRLDSTFDTIVVWWDTTPPDGEWEYFQVKWIQSDDSNPFHVEKSSELNVTTTAYTIKNLDNSTSYDVWVEGSPTGSEAAEVAESESSAILTWDPTPEIEIVATFSTTSTVMVEWLPAMNTEQEWTSFTIRWTVHGDEFSYFTTKAYYRSFLITGLKSDTDVNVIIEGETGNTTAQSDPVIATTYNAPRIDLSIVKLKLGSFVVNLASTFGTPQNQISDVTLYLTQENRLIRRYFVGNDSSCTFDDLTDDTHYSLWASGSFNVNQTATSAIETIKTYSTNEDYAIKITKLLSFESSELYIEWETTSPALDDVPWESFRIQLSNCYYTSTVAPTQRNITATNLYYNTECVVYVQGLIPRNQDLGSSFGMVESPHRMKVPKQYFKPDFSQLDRVYQDTYNFLQNIIRDLEQLINRYGIPETMVSEDFGYYNTAEIIMECDGIEDNACIETLITLGNVDDTCKQVSSGYIDQYHLEKLAYEESELRRINAYKNLDLFSTNMIYYVNAILVNANEALFYTDNSIVIMWEDADHHMAFIKSFGAIVGFAMLALIGVIIYVAAQSSRLKKTKKRMEKEWAKDNSYDKPVDLESERARHMPTTDSNNEPGPSHSDPLQLSIPDMNQPILNSEIPRPKGLYTGDTRRDSYAVIVPVKPTNSEHSGGHYY